MSALRIVMWILSGVLSAQTVYAEDYLLFTFYEYIDSSSIQPATVPQSLPVEPPRHQTELVVCAGQPFHLQVIDGRRKILLQGLVRTMKDDQYHIEFQRSWTTLPADNGEIPSPRIGNKVKLTMPHDSPNGSFGKFYPAFSITSEQIDPAGARRMTEHLAYSVRRWTPTADELK